MKENASWYASSFSSALSSSVNSEEVERERRSKREQKKKQNERRASLNTMLGLEGVSQEETEKMMKEHLYPVVEKAPEVEIKVPEVMGKKKG